MVLKENSSEKVDKSAVSTVEATVPLLVIAGPTASGKTALSVTLAERLNGEVVCADSMQIYRDFEVATARPTIEEMRGVPHWLFGCTAPNEPFSVATYAPLARESINNIHARGRLPILCGGTGQYIRAVTDHLQYAAPAGDETLRAELRERAERDGGNALLTELRELDPETAQRLHPNDIGRIVRAIETVRLSGMTISEQNRLSRAEPSPYRVFFLQLDCRDRELLYRRINQRVEEMLQNGLIEETERFLALPDSATCTAAIGWKEMAPYLRGEMSLEQAKANLQQATRRYAKRQMSWFRQVQRERAVSVCDIGDFSSVEEMADFAIKEMKRCRWLLSDY